jgi:hypothetical protein
VRLNDFACGPGKKIQPKNPAEKNENEGNGENYFTGSRIWMAVP